MFYEINYLHIKSSKKNYFWPIVKEHFQNENSVLILFARLLNCFKLWDTAMPTFWMNSSLFQFQRPSLIESEKEEGNFFLFFNCSKEQIA